MSGHPAAPTSFLRCIPPRTGQCHQPRRSDNLKELQQRDLYQMPMLLALSRFGVITPPRKAFSGARPEVLDDDLWLISQHLRDA